MLHVRRIGLLAISGPHPVLLELRKIHALAVVGNGEDAVPRMLSELKLDLYLRRVSVVTVLDKLEYGHVRVGDQLAAEDRLQAGEKFSKWRICLNYRAFAATCTVSSSTSHTSGAPVVPKGLCTATPAAVPRSLTVVPAEDSSPARVDADTLRRRHAALACPRRQATARPNNWASLWGLGPHQDDLARKQLAHLPGPDRCTGERRYL